MRKSADDNAAELADIDEDEAMTRRAINVLGSQCDDAYEAALAELRGDTREWWGDVLDRDPEDLKFGEQPATADADRYKLAFECGWRYGQEALVSVADKVLQPDR